MMTMAGFKKWFKWIAKNDKKFRTDEALTWKYGQLFNQKPLTKQELVELAALLSGVYPFRVGECYMNAGKLALEHELTYCEGYAAGIWPVPHAWISWRGHPVDVTWPPSWASVKDAFYEPTDDGREIVKRVQFNAINCVYVGIEIQASDLRTILLRRKRWGLASREYLQSRILCDTMLETGAKQCQSK